MSQNPSQQSLQQRLAELQVEIERQAQRIADLERSAGLGPPTHRHLKRGSVYAELGRGEVQSSREIVEGDQLVIYRAENGSLWARPPEEFDDGRFKPLV
ncbi:MAG: hypothetical protein JWQ90_3716 [Hydrocarboniphaga sp.]|uniref:hypothetical protein n=1 Tax=Hydrocarboniphaga sp. TaxID=2033016 RepID=UPI0026070034|nr:hypothetical protein [Hydrocarboniphaga sp.]MDB5971266.1 hypothetical protein [Hydrocarboniphaga sp.]